MRLVFMGTPAFAATCLSALLETGHEIIGVYTKPDTPKNRGMKMSISEVKEVALRHGLPIYQPQTFKDEAVRQTLRELSPDLIIAVAYGKILPKAVLEIPPKGCINIHGSILPALRGAAPVQWAVLNGLRETGVTAMYMSPGMDEGDVIEIRKTPVDPAETAGELMDRLAVIGASLLCDTVRAIDQGTVHRTPQDPALASYAPMLTKELSEIDWTKTQWEILCQIRGLNPWPIATTTLGGTFFKIYAAEPCEGSGAEPGQPIALNKRGLVVSCGDGAVLITRLQAQGGKVLAAPDYFRGHPITLYRE